MLNKNPAILVWFAAIMFLGLYSFYLYELLSKSYKVEENHLYRVGTFQLLNRAHQQSDRYGRGSTGKKKLIFQSTNYYSFTIDKNTFPAITDVKKLKDTLMYAGLNVTVYTDTKNFERYQSAIEPTSLKVFQIEIGGKKYIDISKMNRRTRSRVLSELIFWPFIILSFWFALTNKIRYSSKWKMIILCIAWVMIFIVVILVT